MKLISALRPLSRTSPNTRNSQAACREFTICFPPRSCPFQCLPVPPIQATKKAQRVKCVRDLCTIFARLAKFFLTRADRTKGYYGPIERRGHCVVCFYSKRMDSAHNFGGDRFSTQCSRSRMGVGCSGKPRRASRSPFYWGLRPTMNFNLSPLSP